MLVIDTMRLATRMFRTNLSRTLLTILGISVGIGAILFLVSLGYGLQKMILERITTSDALLSLDVSAGDVASFKMNDNSIQDIKSIDGVDEVLPLATVQSQIKIDDISSELTMNFANRNYFKLDGTILAKGDFYTDSPEDKNKIIISSSALNLFNVSLDDIFSKKIKFTIFKQSDEENNTGLSRKADSLQYDFEVIGVIDEENSNYVYLPFIISKEQNLNEYSKLKVKVKSEDNIDFVRNSIMDKGYIVSALSDIIEQANQIFKIVQIVLASFGIVALTVSAIGMFNTMTIALLERTQEIGIMKALGATSADIWKMFLTESLLIGFLGGLGGIMIGFLGGELFNYLLNFLAGAMGGEKIDMFYTPYWFTVLIISFSTIVGILTGFYPAKRAAKINALEALRYK